MQTPLKVAVEMSEHREYFSQKNGKTLKMSLAKFYAYDFLPSSSNTLFRLLKTSYDPYVSSTQTQT